MTGPHNVTVDPGSPKKVLYIDMDMDNTLVDFRSGINRLSDADRAKFKGRFDDAPGIFSLMDPIDGALDAFRQLAEAFDTYILSTAPWNNPTAWTDKLLWVKQHLGEDRNSPAYKRLILSHHKNLNHGDYIIDDRTARGVDKWEQGKHIHFGQDPYRNWNDVLAYLLPRA
ncbi:hypothetical protein [Gordonia sp. ABSL49_1]|uniref:5' nucleotidase, NT5C type n=1 Tax=Gordonia sp. ABSL49_1 TaxID=2920941 RepID=UPI001F0D0D5B|nr:hypothetical protein [Gordonia sp. ABSL49_1]MCH5642283.1 hypothetical protein [Gordonia sp. ABSL49_1]